MEDKDKSSSEEVDLSAMLSEKDKKSSTATQENPSKPPKGPDGNSVSEKKPKKPAYKAPTPVSPTLLETEAPALTSSSIMSAPHEKHTFALPIALVFLVLSLIANAVLGAFLFMSAREVERLTSDVAGYKEDIIELKNKLNALDNS
ncbi:hypothetical protein IJH27_01500 [Candidatus Saccharibacteria bacterium]|nr:hypothetical protein [Candidatus Saccharibacteria bacterium]